MAAARRRGNGEGTIVKRPDGRYHAAAFVPVTGGGRRRVFVYGRTREDAPDKLDDLLRKAADGIPRARERQTVAAYLDYWLEHVVKPERRATTYKGYETMVRVHIKPLLGKKLDELGPTDVRWLLAALREKETSGTAVANGSSRPAWSSSPTRCCGTHCRTPCAMSLISRNAAKLVKMSNPEYDMGRRPRPDRCPGAADEDRR
jgi:hypothetical protein